MGCDVMGWNGMERKKRKGIKTGTEHTHVCLLEGVRADFSEAWKQVCNKVNSECSTSYTPIQCENQFNNLKKEFKVSLCVCVCVACVNGYIMYMDDVSYVIIHVSLCIKRHVSCTVFFMPDERSFSITIVKQVQKKKNGNLWIHF